MDTSVQSSKENYYHRLFYSLLMITAFVLGILLLVSTVRLFFLLFLAILIAIPIRNGGQWVAAQTPISVNWGVFITAGAFLTLLILVLWFVGPELLSRFDEFYEKITETSVHLRDQLQSSEIGSFLVQRIDLQSSSNLLQMLPDPIRTLSDIFSTMVAPIFTVFVLYILGIMFAINPQVYRNLIVRAFPDSFRPSMRDMLASIGDALGWWLVARVTSIIVIGLLTYVGLILLETPLPLTLAILAGLLSFIPNIGPVLSAIPAGLVAASVSWQMVLYVLLLYAILQTIESYLITPYVEKRTVSLPPALTISVQAILTFFAGIIGALVAAPLLVMVMILVEKLYYPYILKKDAGEINYHIG